jgi:hypothetical protein
MKKFYTEKDIEELFNTGTKSLRVDDNVSLTDLAFEKAKRLGLQLLFDDVELPPLAPIRPYLSNGSSLPSPRASAKPKVDPISPAITQPQTDVAQRIRSSVRARLGNRVELRLLDSIIERVLKATGVK